MSTKTIFLFSGQGSHYYQMGKELFDEEKVFKEWMLKGNELFFSKTGIDLIEELYYKGYKKSDVFNRTLLTHPAIFLFEYALAQVLMQRSVMPDYVLGTSLGEFAAAAVAGVMSFEDAFSAVVMQAESLENYCAKGGMLAVLEPVSLYQEKLSQMLVELSGVNFANHFVVSGLEKHLTMAEDYLKKQGVFTQKLAVSQAFHSSNIDSARDVYLTAIKELTFKQARIPWISCCKNQVLMTAETIYLWEFARLPILFQQAIQNLEAKGSYLYLDLGPSGTLANFVKYNLSSTSSSQVLPLCTLFGSQLCKLESVVEAL
jgi:acyl transferase domain-containing protein